MPEQCCFPAFSARPQPGAEVRLHRGEVWEAPGHTRPSGRPAVPFTKALEVWVGDRGGRPEVLGPDQTQAKQLPAELRPDSRGRHRPSPSYTRSPCLPEPFAALARWLPSPAWLWWMSRKHPDRYKQAHCLTDSRDKGMLDGPCPDLEADIATCLHHFLPSPAGSRNRSPHLVP